jgi:hypothetical protein
MPHQLPSGSLEQARLLGAPQVREVRGDEQVGGRLVALAAQPLEQLGRGAPAQLEVLAPLLLERRERRLVAVLGAAVVHDDVGLPAEGHDGGGQQAGEEQREPDQQAAATTDQGDEHGVRLA